mmetsp:Transcript_20639/g.34453  ORF Transcript_20639/g.34453 Transcript_20639/m.34453 type:complete len:103 (+) Transcript_20639:78-386(+)
MYPEEYRTVGIVIASVVLCFSCCCLALCGVVAFFCVNGIPQRFHKPLEDAVEELQKKGYLPRLDDFDEDLRGEVEEKLPDLEDLEEVEKKLENVFSPKVALN